MLLHMTSYSPLMVLSLLFSLLIDVAKKANLQKIVALGLLLQDDEFVTLQL